MNVAFETVSTGTLFEKALMTYFYKREMLR